MAAVKIGASPNPNAKLEVYMENPKGKRCESMTVGIDPTIIVTAPLSQTPNKMKPKYAMKVLKGVTVSGSK